MHPHFWGKMLQKWRKAEFNLSFSLLKNPSVDFLEVSNTKEILFHVYSGGNEMNTVTSWEEYQALYKESIENNADFWKKQALEVLDWNHEFKHVNDSSFEDGMIAWFLMGKLNVCENCVDRHVQAHGDRTALIWEKDEPGQQEYITYRQLQKEVSRCANVLRHNGIRKGDIVALYMPMIPEAIYAMLACARIGAIHNVVFAGFSAEALRDRIQDSRAKAVFTVDEGLRGRKVLPLKRTVDEAVIGMPNGGACLCCPPDW